MQDTEEFIAVSDTFNLIREVVNATKKQKGLKDTELAKLVGGGCSAGTLRRFLNDEVKTTAYGKSLWDWINKDDIGRELLNAKIEEREGEILRSTFAKELNNFFNEESRFHLKKLEKLEGHFVVYRRFFRSLDTHIMIMNLTCGIDKDPTKFELRSKFNDINGKPVNDVISGFFVAHSPENFFSFYGKITTVSSVCNMTVNMYPPHNPPKFDQGWGKIMVSVPNKTPAPSPVFISRVEEPTIPDLVEISEFKKDANKSDVFRTLEL